MSTINNASNNASTDPAAAGAGIAALALLSQLVETLVANRKLSAAELQDALDAALLSLETGQADSPVPEAAACARRCLEQLLSGTTAPAERL